VWESQKGEMGPLMIFLAPHAEPLKKKREQLAEGKGLFVCRGI